MNQIAWSWDAVSKSNALKGCLHAAIVGMIFGAGDYLLEQAGTFHFADPLLEGLAIAAVSAGYNAVRQYFKGETPVEENFQ